MNQLESGGFADRPCRALRPVRVGRTSSHQLEGIDSRTVFLHIDMLKDLHPQKPRVNKLHNA